MAVSYKKLWRLLVDKEMSKSDLRKKADIVEYVPDAEIWDLYSEDRILLGKEHIRGKSCQRMDIIWL